jgi:hypothetical protein
VALPTSGTISINDLRVEFGDSGSSSLSEFYRGGGLVPATRTTSTTTYEPSSTTYEYSLVSPLYGWVQDESSPFTIYLYWNDVQLVQFSDSSFGATSSYTHTDGWTYIRTANPSATGINLGNIIVSVFPIRRQKTTTTVTNINTGVPTSGTISLSNFYGATA